MPTKAEARKWAAKQAGDTTQLIEKHPRSRVVRGWSFLYYSDTPENKAVKAKIERYLETGLRSDLPESYHRLFDHIMKEVLDGTFR